MSRKHSIEHPHHQRGFSLIEAVVVVGVIAVVIALGYPRLATLAASYRLDGAARKLAIDLQNVRLRAISEGKCLQVAFNTATRGYQVLGKAGISPCGTTGFTSDTPERALDDASAIQVSASASPVFDTRGNGSTASVITLTAADGSVRLVAVNAVGRVNVQ